MYTLVVGGAASGKSAWAEGHACSLLGPRVYVATMRPYDMESHARVARHRERRGSLAFATVECPVGLQSLAVPPDATVLLDALGTLVANELFDQDGLAYGPAETPAMADGDPAMPVPGASVELGQPGCVAAAVASALRRLAGNCAHVTVVAEEVAADGGAYGAGTRTYRRELAWAERKVARDADVVVEVVAGIPNVLKGAACLEGSLA